MHRLALPSYAHLRDSLSMRNSTRAFGALRFASALALAACSDASTSPTPPPVVAIVPPAACAGALSLTAGQVVTAMPGSSLCIGGVASAAEYALVPFNGDTSSVATFTVSATGVAAPGASADVLASSGASSAFSTTVAPAANSFPPARAFEMTLRLSERAALTPRIPGARAWAQSRSTHATYDVIPGAVSVGQLLTLNANAKIPCGSPIYRVGRVAAVTNRAIVVADTGNPAAGFSDAEYASLGTTFDTLVDPLDRAAFGDPSDIDNNGRVVLFFTKTVNDLTPATSGSYVGGFFFARDLFPPQGTADACAGSNSGEMFYVMVPDPTRGGPFTKSNVATEVTATLAHEYQHLINASRRLYVNNANVFEVSWLDEGLAHEAEELLFYRASGLAPHQNIDVASLRRSPAVLSAFNSYQSSNFGRYQEYLKHPSAYSPIATNDSLATRGASWSFLRYATDRLGATDGSTWYSLVNSTTNGLSNLQNVFGSNVISQLRDWGVSVIADEVPGVVGSYLQPSWNFPSVYAALSKGAAFPLATASLASGTTTVSLVRGANAYLRFAVAAGGSASVQWSSAPSSVQFSLVRLN